MLNKSINNTIFFFFYFSGTKWKQLVKSIVFLVKRKTLKKPSGHKEMNFLSAFLLKNKLSFERLELDEVRSYKPTAFITY